jgi:4-alpha-glucanotransferase
VPYGVGDLGPAGHAWVDTLARAGQSWWQVLPVGPTGYGDSPYQSPSTFAGNLNLISPDRLAADGLADAADVTACELPPGPVDYSAVIPRKQRLVRRAWDRFKAGAPADQRAAFRAFQAAEAGWLEDFALFMAVKDAHEGVAWWDWPGPLAARDPAAVEAAARDLHDAVDAHRFGQFLFFRQWSALREHAHRAGVRIVGDLPIYVALDSADVWAHPDLFLLDADRRPRVVAGVPPDYFSRTGQLWGNPIYDWESHGRSGFAWWVARMRSALNMFDQVRIDHFRGVEAYWAVPFGDPTAENGRWLPGPRDDLLRAIQKAVGDVPVIAEDLGFITPEVEALRERFRLPGIRLLQFAFGGAVEPRFLPHRYCRDAVVFTGTHDNDTTRGWWDKLTPEERDRFVRYAPEAVRDPVWALIRLGFASVADLVVVPAQDLLGLGSEARMNTPGNPTGNWRWRATEAELADRGWQDRLLELTTVYERARPR